jgi:hypothetical protein
MRDNVLESSNDMFNFLFFLLGVSIIISSIYIMNTLSFHTSGITPSFPQSIICYLPTLAFITGAMIIVSSLYIIIRKRLNK